MEACSAQAFGDMLLALVEKAVDERIGAMQSREDAMARLHGEYVTIKRAAAIINVSQPTVRKLAESGALELTPVGIAVRSIAHLGDAKEAIRRGPRQRTAKFEKIRP